MGLAHSDKFSYSSHSSRRKGDAKLTGNNDKKPNFLHNRLLVGMLPLAGDGGPPG